MTQSESIYETHDLLTAWNSLVKDPHFPHSVELLIDEDLSHFKQARSYAYAELDPKQCRVFFSTKVFNLRYNNVLGLLLHELGHILAFYILGPDHSEREADLAAKEYFRITVYYDENDVQTISPSGVSPRPAWLPQ